MNKQGRFVKPAQFAEHEIIKNIVSNKWEVGQSLLPERELADFLGITRPTYGKFYNVCPEMAG